MLLNSDFAIWLGAIGGCCTAIAAAAAAYYARFTKTIYEKQFEPLVHSDHLKLQPPEGDGRMLLHVGIVNSGTAVATAVSVKASITINGSRIDSVPNERNTISALFPNVTKAEQFVFSFPIGNTKDVLDVELNIHYKGVGEKEYDYKETRHYHGGLATWQGGDVSFA